MNLEKYKEFVNYTKTLSDRERLILNLKSKREHFNISLLFYLGAILFIIKEAMQSFATAVNSGFTIGNFDIFFSSVILMGFAFIYDFYTYIIFLALSAIILYFYNMAFNKNRKEEKRISKKIKKHMDNIKW